MKVFFASITAGQVTVKFSVLFKKYIFTTQVLEKREKFLKLTKENVQELIKALKESEDQKNKEIFKRLTIDVDTLGKIRVYTRKSRQIEIKRKVFLEALEKLK